VKRTRGGAKPGVLAVDDHRDVLDKVAVVSANESDVVGVATGGEAIAIAGMVLDINMPGLDGYQTKSALDHAGSRVAVRVVAHQRHDHRSSAPAPQGASPLP
jgi:DNA-binding response OmpR family regulator